MSYLVFVFSFSLVFFSVPCARLSWPSHQLLSAHKYTVSYRVCHLGSLQSTWRCRAPVTAR